MNWKNVNLNSNYESSQNILDPFDFDTLLLEISCNVKDINKESVFQQAIESIDSKYQTAIEILKDNLINITNKAIEYRNIE